MENHPTNLSIQRGCCKLIQFLRYTHDLTADVLASPRLANLIVAAIKNFPHNEALQENAFSTYWPLQQRGVGMMRGEYYGKWEENWGKAQALPLVFQALERFPHNYEIVIGAFSLLAQMLNTEMNEWPDPMGPRTIRPLETRYARSYFLSHPDCMRTVEHAAGTAQAHHPDDIYIHREFHMLRYALDAMELGERRRQEGRHNEAEG